MVDVTLVQNPAEQLLRVAASPGRSLSFCLSTVLAGCSTLNGAPARPELLELRQTTSARLMEDSHR
jgi:hypothetical protein